MDGRETRSGGCGAWCGGATALWQLAWAELYSEVETEQPPQFTNLPTDFNLDYWDYNAANSASQIALYELAIESL